MIIITNEYVYNNIKLHETHNIVEKTLLQNIFEYGDNYDREVEPKCVAEFLDKIKNEIKIEILKRYNVIEELNKIMQSSKGMCKLFRIVQSKIIKEGKIYENLTDFYLRCENIPILWKNFFVRIANKRDNRFKSYSEQCCERHFLII